MLRWTDELMKHEQYQDLLREMENRALVQRALAGQEQCNGLVRQLVGALARSVTLWGCYLVERFTQTARRPADRKFLGAPKRTM